MSIFIPTPTPRRIWADYFDGQGIQYAFFSAANAAALQQARRDATAQAEEEQLQDEVSLSDSDGPDTPSDDVSEDDFTEEPVPKSPPQSESDTDDEHQYVHTEEDSPDGKDPRTKVLSVLELEDLFVTTAPDLSSEARLFFVSFTKAYSSPIGSICWPNWRTSNKTGGWARWLSQCR